MGDRRWNRMKELLYICLFLLVCSGSVLHLTANVILQITETANEGPKYVGAEYAFEVDSTNNSSKTNDDLILPLIGPIEAFIKTTSGDITDYITSRFPFRDELVYVCGQSKKLTGLNTIEAFPSNVVTLSDGHLSLINEARDYHDDVRRVIEFAEDLKSDGIQFLFFEPPEKFDSTKYTGPYKNYSDEQATEINLTLREAGVTVLSIEEEIEKLGIDKSPMFFWTDHHWLPQTALWADSLLANKLNDDYGYSINPEIFDIENYTVEIYPNKFLGSLGTKVTMAYSEKEDFPLVLPNYSTDFTVFRSDIASTVTGTLPETLLNLNKLKIDDSSSVLSENYYAIYGFSDQALIRIHNNQCSDGKRVLFIKKSSANSMHPFFAATVENVDVIDLRHFRGSIQTFIKETKPDTVVMIYGTSSFGSEEKQFNFK